MLPDIVNAVFEKEAIFVPTTTTFAKLVDATTLVVPYISVVTMGALLHAMPIPEDTKNCPFCPNVPPAPIPPVKFRLPVSPMPPAITIAPV